VRWPTGRWRRGRGHRLCRLAAGEKNPVGTCYIAAAAHGKPTLVERHVFPGDRNGVRLAAVGAALDLIAKRLA
jgi:nicotinamide mononucleotide (NMN) deamidase PncC